MALHMARVKWFHLIFIVALVYGVKPPHPHIVLVFVDDLGWNDLSLHGATEIPTPNIDVLAKDGIRLDNYYVQPTCSPSRSALMTGKYPMRFGMGHLALLSSEARGLSLNETLLPQYLKSLNYVTYGVGKWHLGFFKEDYLPMRRGFDQYFGYWTYKEDYFTHYSTTGNMTGLDLHDNYENAWDYEGYYGTELFGDKAKQFIKKHDPRKPMFLYLAQQPPQMATNEDVYQVPERYLRHIGGIKEPMRRKYAGMIRALDESIGEVVEQLEKSKMLDDTLFIFSTDNGGSTDGSLGVKGLRGSNWPLRGGKFTNWDGGVRAVGFMWSPSIRNFSRVDRHLMHVSDWLPTILSAIGANSIVDNLKIDGYNLWPSILYNAPSPRTEILHNIDEIDKAEAIRRDRYKLVKGTPQDGQVDGWTDEYGQYHKGTIPRHNPLHIDRLQAKIIYEQLLKESRVARIFRKKYGLTFNPNKPTQLNEVMHIKCLLNPRPFNNCNPTEASCLFDIEMDPCEFHNIADKYPEVVKELESALDGYRSQAAPPGNLPSDPRADPKLHGGAWMPWL